MGLKDLFKPGIPDLGTGNSDDYIELEVEEGESRIHGPTRYVRVCKLKGFADVDKATRELSAGNVVVLDIKPLAERSMNELRHAVDEIKDIVISMGGDIAGLTDYQLIITPPTMKIQRGEETRDKGFEESIERIRQKQI